MGLGVARRQHRSFGALQAVALRYESTLRTPVKPETGCAGAKVQLFLVSYYR